MKVWSKGLGQIVLNMDLRRYYLEFDDDGNLLVKGKITDPVLWQFKLTIFKDDIPGLANVALQKGILAYVLRNFYMVFQFVFEKISKRSKFIPAE